MEQVKNPAEVDYARHSCLKGALEEILNLILEHITLNDHSLIITREGLILTLSILITLTGGIFEYHPVSRDRFAQFPLCREWIRKSCP